MKDLIFFFLLSLFSITLFSCSDNSTNGGDPPANQQKPAYEVKSVDFGALESGTSKDTLVSNFIKNNGRKTFTVDSLKIVANSAGEFKNLSTLAFPLTVKPNEGVSINLNYSPKTTDSSQAQVVVYFSDTTITSKLKGKVITIPKPPTNLMAATADENTINLKWDPSPDESEQAFSGYEIFATGENISLVVSKGTKTAHIKGLTTSKIYTFNVRSISIINNEKVYSNPVSIEWATATRIKDQVKIYEFASTNGSGLDIFDESTGGPVLLKISEKSRCDIILDTRDNFIRLGSASKIDFGTGTTKSVVEFCNSYYEADSLKETFDYEDMSHYGNYNEMILDISLIANMTSKCIVFNLRILEPCSTQPNYAKLLIRRGPNGFLQGYGSNRYIVCEISYQKKKGLPYA
jgi:hypothetical protein